MDLADEFALANSPAKAIAVLKKIQKIDPTRCRGKACLHASLDGKAEGGPGPSHIIPAFPSRRRARGLGDHLFNTRVEGR
jgi:hypothetical protein